MARRIASTHRDRAAALAFILAVAATHSAEATESCSDGLDLGRVLAAHGAEHQGEVQAFDFAFHVNREGREIVRRWHWQAPGQVTLTTTNEDGSPLSLTFESPAPAGASEPVLEADRWFVNDRYWLFFPHPLAWESGMTVTVTCDPQPLPLGGGSAPRFTVTYGPEGGYTPGDAYDFYTSAEGLILQWVFRRDAAAEPTLAVRFEEYARVGPVVIALSRVHQDGTSQPWFTDVSVTTAEGTFTPVAMASPSP